MTDQSTLRESGKQGSPVLYCRELPAFDFNNWDSIEKAFADADKCVLQQTWRTDPDPQLRPGFVKIGYRENQLWILSEFEDSDIFNSADGPQQETWLTGDVLEIFLRPQHQESYFEFHVTPQNQILLLRWPSKREIELLRENHEAGSNLTPYFYDEPALRSWTRVEPERERWSTLVALDCNILSENGAMRPGDIWLCSFCRYDYTRGIDMPILSSSSAHQEPNYHLLGDWSQLHFVP